MDMIWDGISRELKDGICRFQAALEEHDGNLHSLLLMQNGEILAEGYQEPYGPDRLHRMYSVTKSLTSIAIGLLEEEGKLKLTDRICMYFPEYLPHSHIHPWLWETRIEDLLSMRTCHSKTTYKQTETKEWTASFFQTEPDHCPGTVFFYDTSASVVLAALAERLSGMDLLSYLRKKALDEIGVSGKAYILKTPDGVSHGGSGLMCTARDLAKLGDLCCHFGRFGKRQLFPETYMKKAVSRQVGTPLQPVTDERRGYGYQFWMARNGGFTMYGMGGQLVLCFPQKELTFVTTAYTVGDPAGVQSICDAFYSHVYPCLCQTETADCRPGREYGEPSKLHMIFRENASGWKWANITWDGENGTLHYENRRGIWTMPFLCRAEEWGEGQGQNDCGEKRKKGFFLENQPKAPSWAAMYRRRAGFLLRAEQTGEEPGVLWIEAGIRNQEITLHMKQNGDPAFHDYNGLVNGFISGTIADGN